MSGRARGLIFGAGTNDADYCTRPVVNGKQIICPYFFKWTEMLRRVYSKNYLKKNPSYNNCSVSEEWLSFSNFKRWMEKQPWQNRALDKDIRVIGNRIYSPERCLFAPREINALFQQRRFKASSLPTGVKPAKGSSNFEAQCAINGAPQKYIGTFQTPEEAHTAYCIFKANGIRVMAQKYRGEPLLYHAVMNHANCISLPEERKQAA